MLGGAGEGQGQSGALAPAGPCTSPLDRPGSLRQGMAWVTPGPDTFRMRKAKRKKGKKKIFVELMKLKFCKGREGDSQSAGRYLHGLSDWFSWCLFRMLL